VLGPLNRLVWWEVPLGYIALRSFLFLQEQIKDIIIKLVRRLLEEQDKVLRSYFAHKGGMRSKGEDRSNYKGREHVQWDIYA
jgi:hypothetical protein